MVRIARFHRADSGSSPDVGIVEYRIAWLAQSVERKTFNLVVEGSTPSPGILIIKLNMNIQKLIELQTSIRPREQQNKTKNALRSCAT